MSKVPQIDETDIEKLIELAKEEVDDSKVIPWIIEHSPTWRSKGYSEIKAALAEI